MVTNSFPPHLRAGSHSQRVTRPMQLNSTMKTALKAYLRMMMANRCAPEKMQAETARKWTKTLSLSEKCCQLTRKNLARKNQLLRKFKKSSRKANARQQKRCVKIRFKRSHLLRQTLGRSSASHVRRLSLYFFPA